MAQLDKKVKDLGMGTDTTAPGHGVTVRELRVAFQECRIIGSNDVRARLKALPLKAKSHILLTGNPIRSIDLSRIHFAIDEVERRVAAASQPV